MHFFSIFLIKIEIIKNKIIVFRKGFEGGKMAFLLKSA